MIKNTYTNLERTLTIAGLILIVIGFIANIFSAWTNSRFIAYDLGNLSYYLCYLVILGGGFIIGYILTKKTPDHKRRNRLFSGVFYAALAMSLYCLLDLTRVGIQNLFGDFDFPIGKLIFQGMPIFAIIATLIIACISQLKTKRLGSNLLPKIALISSFIIYQLYYFISGIILYNSSTDTGPMWLTIGSFIITPLTIAIVSFLSLNNIKGLFDRIFYSTFIATLSYTFIIVLWDFRTDASYEATNIFYIIVTLIMLILTGFLIWRAHKAIKD